jgi:hypothetical protein
MNVVHEQLMKHLPSNHYTLQSLHDALQTSSYNKIRESWASARVGADREMLSQPWAM